MRSRIRDLGMSAFVLAVTLWLAGCWTYSLQPLYEIGDKHLTYDPALTGIWRADGDHDCELVISADSTRQFYMIEVTAVGGSKSGDCNDPGAGKYEAHLEQLGTSRFLDASPRGDAESRGFIAPHTIFKVETTSNSLSLTPMSDSWLCNATPDVTRNFGQCVRDSDSDPNPDFFITASTAVLQEFIQRHADDENLFYTPDSALWHRAQASGASK